MVIRPPGVNLFRFWDHSVLARFVLHRETDPFADHVRVRLDAELLKGRRQPVKAELTPDTFESLDIGYSFARFLTEMEGSPDPTRLLNPFQTIEQKLGKFKLKTTRFDVNNNGFASPIDANIVINYLNAISNSGTSRQCAGNLRKSVANFYDVNGDGRVTSLDALQIINAF